LSGRGLCDELITRPEESYRLCCVVVCDLETSRMGAPYIYDISRLRVNAFRIRSFKALRAIFRRNLLVSKQRNILFCTHTPSLYLRNIFREVIDFSFAGVFAFGWNSNLPTTRHGPVCIANPRTL